MAQAAVSIVTQVELAEFYRVLVRSMTYLAKDTLAVEFVSADGAELPPFEAGSHIDLILPNGIRRSYSLCNDPCEEGRYVVGVKKAEPSRGASSFVHDELRVGQTIEITPPKNNFPLSGGAALSVLIAGGIGITPVWSMIQKLEAGGQPWRLFYAARTCADAAFLADLRLLAQRHPRWVDIRFDHEPGNVMLDLQRIVADHRGPGVHFYCCGPGPMLDAFLVASAELPPSQVHLERFTAEPQPVSDDARDTFKVVLAKSGQTLLVEDGKSILDTLLDAGVNVAFSCMDGICGSCRVGVLEGTPDHRDMVLTDGERDASNEMMVCCSGSRSDRLVLDL